MVSLVIIFILAYLTGAIPTSIIVGKLLRGIDIRDYGSGNAGGTNVFRVLGWKPGIFVMAFDVFKGVMATLVISSIRVDPVTLDPVVIKIVAGCFAIIGHIWTIFAGFRGGKGVGTAAGMIFALFPVAGLLCLIVFSSVLVISRIVSVSSMSAAIMLPIFLIILKYWFNKPVHPYLFIFGTLIAFLIIFTHRSNIKRLVHGTENRVKLKKVK